MDRDRVGEPQRPGLPIGNLQRAVVGVDDDLLLLGIVSTEEDDRAVHQPEVVRVAGLDQTVTDPEAVVDGATAVGVELGLKALVEGVDPDNSPVHRRQHLDVADRVDPVAARGALGDDLDDGASARPGSGRSMKKKSCSCPSRGSR